MHYHIISIFPEIFDSFLKTSLIAKAQEKSVISVSLVNPRDFCTDKHKQIDDMPYGGGAGMLMKAQPIIDAIQHILKTIGTEKHISCILLGPSEHILTQSVAHDIAKTNEHMILICGRYEGIDHRVELWTQEKFGNQFMKLSLGTFVTLGGEVPAMTMVEATARLLPGVIKEELSRQDESYRPEQGGLNIEYPQYTRPEEVEGMPVPEVLLSGHHAEIKQRRDDQSENML